MRPHDGGFCGRSVGRSLAVAVRARCGCCACGVAMVYVGVVVRVVRGARRVAACVRFVRACERCLVDGGPVCVVGVWCRWRRTCP